jgi:hypothetical protein
MPVKSERLTARRPAGRRPTRAPEAKEQFGARWKVPFPKSLEATRKLAIDVLIVAVIVVALSVAVKATINTAVRFEPISVPEELVKRGLTGEVVTQRIIDEIMRINELAATAMAARTFSASTIERALPKIETPVGGFSLAPIVAYLRELLGYSDVRIVGEIVKTEALPEPRAIEQVDTETPPPAITESPPKEPTETLPRPAQRSAQKAVTQAPRQAVTPTPPTRVTQIPPQGVTPAPTSKFTISIRIVDRGSVDLRAEPTENVDKLVRFAALRLMEKLSPYVLASYLHQPKTDAQ